MANIKYEANGRGAWTKVGGLLQLDRKLNKTVPGPYYMANINDPYMIGVKVHIALKNNQVVTINDYAVYLGVKAIQKRLNTVLGTNLAVDGMLGPKTDAVIKQLQTKLGVLADGMIGPNTSSALFLDVVKAEAKKYGVDWSIVAGLIKQESQFDPGAVGYIDTHDMGLGQINLTSHPDVSVEQAFDTVFAVDYMADRFRAALLYFNGNVRDAVASYNLGYGGTKEWIRKGRPDIWTPSWDSVPRNTKQYIDNILNAF
jgi:peptidoglycan hydrolase-like protein with peptidoglycan-binding domain